MMKKALLILSVIASAISCTKGAADLRRTAEGSVSLRLALDRSKAAMTEEELTDSALLKIYMADFSGLVREHKVWEMPDKIYLPADNYRMDVLLGAAAKGLPASWEQKSYKGSAPFSIRPGTDTTLQVTAKLWSVTVCVEFPDSLHIHESFGDSYTFSIGPSEDERECLVYDPSRAGQDGYLVVSEQFPTMFWTFSGIHQIHKYRFTKTGEITDVKPGARYTMRPRFNNHDGVVSFDIAIDSGYTETDDIIVFEPKSSGMSPCIDCEIWSRHATVHADVDEGSFPEQDKIKFEYTSDGGQTWTSSDAVRVSEGAYAATLTELEGSTEYRCRLLYDGETVDEGITFTTRPEKQLPNWDFETVSNAEGSKYKAFYNPASSDPELKAQFWDSGNKGSADFNFIICDASTEVPTQLAGVSTYCAKLSSQYAVVKFAAGNLFAGEFAGLVGTKGGIVNFGRPWETKARPSEVSFWYKYNGGKVDHGGNKISEGTYDICSIKFAIGTWTADKCGGTATCPVQVNTTEEKTIAQGDFGSLEQTIAFCTLEEAGNAAGSGQWRQVTIPFEYKDTTVFPTHIIVSAAASKYGDYFQGCSSSELYIDNVELIYD